MPIYEFIELNEHSNLSINNKISDSLYLDIIKDNITVNFIQYKDIITIYISKLFIIKQFELTLIQNNITYNQYPYSSIKLNNSRYYYHSKYSDINLHVYICTKIII